MKGAIFMTIMCLVSASWAIEEEYKKAVGECATELDVKMGDGGEPDKDDADAKCLAKCVGEKMGIMDESGNINEDLVPEDWKPAVKECNAEIAETDLCKRPIEMEQCVMAKVGHH